MNLAAPELLILLFMVPYGVIIWGIVDAASRPEWAWQAAGQNARHVHPRVTRP